MKKLILISVLNLLFVAHAQAEQNLPNLECEIIQVAGNLNTFNLPAVGDKLVLNLNKPQDIIQNGRIIFSGGGYISMNNMPSFKLERIMNSTHDSGGIRLSTSQGHRHVRIEILGQDQRKSNAWLINEGIHSQGATLGIMGLVCLGD